MQLTDGKPSQRPRQRRGGVTRRIGAREVTGSDATRRLAQRRVCAARSGRCRSQGASWVRGHRQTAAGTKASGGSLPRRSKEVYRQRRLQLTLQARGAH